MKCPQCNNDLTFSEMGGKNYIICKNCKKVYDPAEFSGGSNDDEPESPKLALSICSMVFGIIGLLLSCIWIGIVPALIGLILGIIALATHHSKGMAIAGVVTSAIGIIIAAFILITGTAASSILENQGLPSLDKSKKETVKKEADESKDESKDTPKPEEPTAAPEPEQPADDNMIDFNMGEYVVKYTGHAIGNDYEGNPCLIVYYDFTNNSNETTTAQMHSYIQVFQNGTQCESAFFMDENEAIRNYSTNIQPGITINVGEPFKISDMSNVTIEASEAFSINGAKDTMVIQLQ